MATEGQIVVGVDGEKHIFYGGRWQSYLDWVENGGGGSVDPAGVVAVINEEPFTMQVDSQDEEDPIAAWIQYLIDQNEALAARVLALENAAEG